MSSGQQSAIEANRAHWTVSGERRFWGRFSSYHPNAESAIAARDRNISEGWTKEGGFVAMSYHWHDGAKWNQALSAIDREEATQ